MKLYLMRHGQAVENEQDSLRHLTEKGEQDARKIGDFLKKAKIQIGSLKSSKKIRAIQTAQIIASSLLPNMIVEQIDGLAPNDSAAAFLQNADFEKQDIMLIGHQPFLSYLTSLLLSREENRVEILYPTCSVVCLQKRDSELWKLVFAINPQMI